MFPPLYYIEPYYHIVPTELIHFEESGCIHEQEFLMLGHQVHRCFHQKNCEYESA